MERTLVPLVAGLMVRNADPATAPYPPNLELRWSEVQPDASATFVTTMVDDALATGRPFRLRPMCGTYAPQWLCDRVGTFTYVEHQSGRTFAVPRWWHPEYVAAYRSFIRALGVYDGRLSAVFIVGAMTVYAEPCIRAISDPTTRTNLLAAGYTLAADLAAQHAAIAAHAEAFVRTRAAMAFNAYQHVGPDGVAIRDPAITSELMTRLRAACGPGSILQNNSLRSSYLTDIATANGDVYAQLLAHGVPFSFQTARSAAVGDLPAVLDWVVHAGGHAVELPFGHGLSPKRLARYDEALRANAS